MIGRNVTFPIYKENGEPFFDLVLQKATVESVVMSLGDKITGDVYYKDNTLSVTTHEYITYDNVNYVLVSPPTIVREGMVRDNSELKGMTKYSFEFYHPMYILSNIPFTDVAVSSNEELYLSQNKTFSWIGYPNDYIAKLNKNLQGTEWIVVKSSRDKDSVLSDVLSFDNNTIADALKTGYETWQIPYVVSKINEGDEYYSQGKRFLVTYGLPSNEIYESETDRQANIPYVFRFGQGVGLKNNSRTPRKNKIITRISGYGSEDNIPYGYPQIQWYGNQDWDYTINNESGVHQVTLHDGRVVNAMSYPIYDGIVGGAKVRLIKHPFTRNHLMPSIYGETIFNKVSQYVSWGGGETIPAYNITLSQLKRDIGQKIQHTTDSDVAACYNELISALTVVGNYTTARTKSVSGTHGAASYAGVISKSRNKLIDGYFNITINETVIETEFESVLVEKDFQTENIDFDPTIEIVDYYDAISDSEHQYPNEIKPNAPSYEIHEFADIKPELGEESILNAFPINNDTTQATEWIDDIDDGGNFVQSYFKITLPVLSFDLYASAAITQEMQISMRSGDCIGCTFTVQVDWDDYRNNFYDDNGNFAPEGTQRDYTKYPDSRTASIDIILQKENSTFGTIMPSIYQQPQNGDTFVVLGISLPVEYIQNAESRLDESMKSYMLENNIHYFDYPLKFDEYFLATHIYILNQLQPNNIVRFQYGNELLELYVKQIVVKYGQSPLPQYDITLTDDIEVVLNQIGQVADDVEHLSSLVSLLRQNGSQNVIVELARKLSKAYDDTASGLITFLKGLVAKARSFFENGAEFGTYIKDASGAKIDALGDAEFREIRGREALIVPEVRFELAKGVVGVETQCSCGGQIKEVDTTGGVISVNNADIPYDGSCTLMLEEGEYGRIEVGDLCMGVWHHKDGSNAGETSDDRKGNITYKGFSTIYFRIVHVPVINEIVDGVTVNKNSDSHLFYYSLRPETTEEQQEMLDHGEITADELLAVAGGNGIHPYPLMHFYGRGNSEMNEQTGKAIHPERQKFTLRTPEYTARLTDVSNWYFGIPNYTYVNGNLEGFEALLSELGQNPFGDKEKFGTIDCSLWMKGTIVQLPNATDYFMIAQSKLGLLREDESEIVSFKVLDTYRNNKTNAYNYNVYRGETQLSKTITVSQDGLNATFTLNYSDLNDNDSATFRIRGTEKPPIQGSTAKVIEETFLVMKNVANRGADAVMFLIQGDETAFHITKSGAVVPMVIPFKIIKVTGSLREDKTTEYADRVIVDYNGTGTQYDTYTDEVTSQSFANDTTMATVSVYEESGFSVVSVDGKAVAKKDGVTLTPLAVATFPVIRDGSDGVNAVIADFDDEMHGVACNSDGSPMISDSWITFAQLWLGNTAQEIKEASLITNEYGNLIRLSKVASNMKAQLTVNYNVLAQLSDDVDSLPIKIKLVGKNNDEAFATATIVRVRAGSDGMAVTYKVLPEPSVIKVDKNGVITNCFKSGNDYYIKVKYNKFVNNSLDGVYYLKDDGTGVSGYAFIERTTSGEAVVDGEKVYIAKDSNGIYGLRLELRRAIQGGQVVIERETVPVVKDGSDGLNGTSATLYYSATQNGTYHATFDINTDKWARTRTYDGTTETFGNPFKIVGENGTDIDYKFARSADATTANSKTAPTINGSWSDMPVQTTDEYPYLWMKRTPKIFDADGTSRDDTENVTYIRINGDKGDKGEDGVSSYTWLRYSEDGETFTGEKVDGGLIGDTALLEETVGSALRSRGANLNYFYGANTNPTTSTNGTNNVAIGSSGIMNGKRYIHIQTNSNGDYALRHSLNGIKPSTWYTLEYYSTAQNNYIIYITNGTFDRTAGAFVNGKAFASTSNDFAYTDTNKISNTWRRNVVTFKTTANADGSTTSTYLGFTCKGSGAYAFNFAGISVREGKYDYDGENLLYNGDFSDGVTSWNASENIITRSVVPIDNLGDIAQACQVAYNGTDATVSIEFDNVNQVNLPSILGKQITLSFYARKMNSVATILQAWQYSNSSSIKRHTITTEWQRFEQTFTALATKSNIAFRTTVQTGRVIQLAGVKIELGDTATPWSPSASEQQFGTAEGAWLGTLVWEHPYPSTNFGDYTWTRIKGEDGQKGGRGAMIRSRGEYVATKDGVNVTYLAGGENEKYLDVCYNSSGVAYQCIKSHGEGTSDNHAYGLDNNTYWELMNNFKNVATDLLIAKLAYVENLGVRYVETINGGQGSVSVSDGIIEVFNAFGSRNIRFGVDDNGYAVMQYFDNDGTLLYDLGPNGLGTTDVRTATLSTLYWHKLANSTASSVIQTMFTAANIRMMFGTGQTADTVARYFLAKINAGQKTFDGVYITSAQLQAVNNYDSHYFRESINQSAPRLGSPPLYISDGIYYQPTAASFGSAGSNIKTYDRYGAEDPDYSNYKAYYDNEYKVVWPTSAEELMRNPLLYTELYIVTSGTISKKIKVFMRYKKYIDDGNINK